MRMVTCTSSSTAAYNFEIPYECCSVRCLRRSLTRRSPWATYVSTHPWTLVLFHGRYYPSDWAGARDSGVDADSVPYRIGTRSVEAFREDSCEHRRRIRRLAQYFQGILMPSLMWQRLLAPHLDVFLFEAPYQIGPEPRAPRRL